MPTSVNSTTVRGISLILYSVPLKQIEELRHFLLETFNFFFVCLISDGGVLKLQNKVRMGGAGRRSEARLPTNLVAVISRNVPRGSKLFVPRIMQHLCSSVPVKVGPHL